MVNNIVMVKHLALAMLLLSSGALTAHAAPVIEKRSLSKNSTKNNTHASQTWQMYQKIAQLEAEVENLRNKVEILESRQILEKNQNKKVVAKIESRIKGLETGLVDVINTDKRSTVPKKQDKNALAKAKELKAKELYVAAYNIFKTKGSKAGVQAMRSFIKDHPNNKLLPNAYYWIGEFYLADKKPNYNLATRSFQTVANSYPKSNKASAALYRLAVLADADGNRKLAKRYAQTILSSYGSSKEAALAKAFLKK